jgi:hypothetical protein
MEIVWDPKKAQSNVKKHAVEFSLAATVLSDPLAITIEDKRHDEQRFVTVGMDMLGGILVVVYSYDNTETIRLISARKATKHERQEYEKK